LGDLCSEKADPLHEKISKQVNQLHSALRNISLTPGFLELLKRCSTNFESWWSWR
jgi:hypothetical protein